MIYTIVELVKMIFFMEPKTGTSQERRLHLMKDIPNTKFAISTFQN